MKLQWKRKVKSLRWDMIGTLLLCWVLPLMLTISGVLYFVSSMLSRQIEKTVHVSTEKAVEICEMQIEEMITLSKNASYLSVIKDSYAENKDNRERLSNEVTAFLNQQYRYNGTLLCTMVFFLDNPEELYYTYNTYQDNNGYGYSRVLYFQNWVQNMVAEQSEELGTGVKLMLMEGRLYLIRNLVDADNDFAPYAMIVEELEPKLVFESLNSVWGIVDFEVYIDKLPVFRSDVGEDFPMHLLSEKTEKSVFLQQQPYTFSYKVIRNHDQMHAFLLKLDTKTIIDDLFLLRYVLAFVVIFMIPLMFMVFRFFRKRVTEPVDDLILAAGKIAEGNYGYQVETENMSEEFVSLGGMFNSMSQELKHQFEQIYLEELALKDANIKALQSQINPHFFNNTLEIINWEARMSGNEKVSGMIEALATMLNATMNRKQKRFVTLAEEMTYVDAYLYIIKHRFGERFQTERRIEDGLLEVEVPPLIIQPIVENAVEHGMYGTKQGRVELNIYQNGNKLYIEIRNSGGLSEENKKKIEHLLSDSEISAEEKHISLGIRNVNRRLKIIYGEECGLTIKSDKDNTTISTIIVKIDNDSKNSQ